MVTLYGRFKGETGYRLYCLAICDHNRGSIPFRKWIGWLLCRRVMVQKRESGWLFLREGRWAKISNFDEMFLQYITKVHTLYPSLLSVGTLLDLLSTWRSMRRGAVLEMTGRVDKAVVTLMNRWMTKEGSRGSALGLTMRQTYTQVRDIFPQLRLYSKALYLMAMGLLV